MVAECCKVGGTRYAQLMYRQRGQVVSSRLHLGLCPGSRPASGLVKLLRGLVELCRQKAGWRRGQREQQNTISNDSGCKAANERCKKEKCNNADLGCECSNIGWVAIEQRRAMIARSRKRRRDWRTVQLTSQVFRTMRHRDCARQRGHREDKKGNKGSHTPVSLLG